MASQTSQINVLIDTKTKKEATSVLNELGMSMSTAINIFLKQVIKKDGLPFEIINVKKEVEKSNVEPLRSSRYQRYNNIDEMMMSLEIDKEYK
ncbi:MAG: type II toxin-antitoxin system RelB/DinJ family antitoxin [Bacilli bacterium]|nr:type II toxin-antitoxin system RelB/DinJ family antitoxin [Bacilli bacterium]